MKDSSSFLPDILQFASILTSAKLFGNLHLEELKIMYWSCAMQDEVESGSSKIYSKVINSNHSSVFNRE